MTSEVIERYDRAMAHKDAGDLEAAVSELAEIVAMDDNHVLSHSALAVYLQKLGRGDQAVTHARRVTELDPDDAFAWTQLAVICQRCGLSDQGDKAMARARSLAGGVGGAGGPGGSDLDQRPSGDAFEV